MNVESIKIKDLKEYPGNPRMMPEAMKDRLKKSIIEFGMVEPLVVNKKLQVIGGNQRLTALKELIIEGKYITDTVPCVVVDLSIAKEKALNLALNKISGTWDLEALKIFIEDLDFKELDIDLTGFCEAEIQEINLEKVIGETDPNEEWKGMPNFKQDDITSHRHIIVHFRNATDVESFFALIGDRDTGKTVSIWWPKKENRDTESKRWVNDEDEYDNEDIES